MYKFYHVVTNDNDLYMIKQTNVKQILVSYFYARKNKKMFNEILESDFEILIDSGLYSYSNGKVITEEKAREYCEDYIQFVKDHHENPKIINFFELDFDLIDFNYYEFVKPYQNRLVDITDKIVLITQKGRTIEDIDELLTKNITTVAIPFASNVERKYFDYMYIIDKAHAQGKKVHLLGCSTIEYLTDVEQSDSSAWVTSAIFGNELYLIDNKMKSFYIGEDKNNVEYRRIVGIHNAKEFMKLEEKVNEMKKEKNYEILRLF